MTTQLRVLIVNEICDAAGVITGQNTCSQRIFEESIGLVVAGYRVFPIYLTIGAQHRVERHDSHALITTPARCEVKHLNILPADVFPFETSLCVLDFALMRTIKAFNVDVVNTGTQYGRTDISAKVVASRHKIAHVHSIHTTFDRYFDTYARLAAGHLLERRLRLPAITARVARLPLAGAALARGGRGIEAWLPRAAAAAARRMIDVLSRRVIGTADAILYSDPNDLAQIVRCRPPHPRAHFYMRGLDVRLFSPPPGQAHAASSGAAIGGADRPARLVFAGRIADEKNVLRLIDIVGELATRGIEATITLIGKGPREGAIKDALGPRAILAGQLRQEEMVGILRQSDIYVHPATHESYGMVLAEAKACGLPVVGHADCGSSRIHIADNVNGRVVHEDAPAAWADVLATLIGDTALRQRLATAARADVEKRYLSWPEVVARQIAPAWVDAYAARRGRPPAGAPGGG